MHTICSDSLRARPGYVSSNSCLQRRRTCPRSCPLPPVRRCAFLNRPCRREWERHAGPDGAAQPLPPRRRYAPRPIEFLVSFPPIRCCTLIFLGLLSSLRFSLPFLSPLPPSLRSPPYLPPSLPLSIPAPLTLPVPSLPLSLPSPSLFLLSHSVSVSVSYPISSPLHPSVRPSLCLPFTFCPPPSLSA